MTCHAAHQSTQSLTMAERGAPSTVARCLLAMLITPCLAWAQQWIEQPPADWQTITNLTVANSLVNYQIRSFTEEQTTFHLVIQQNDAQLVKDMVICDNLAYTIDPTKIYIQPLNGRLFSQVGLYMAKVLHQFSETVLNTRKSIAYDYTRQVLLYTHQSRIEALNFCRSLSEVQVITSAHEQDSQITHLAVDSVKGLLLFVESADIDRCLIVLASLQNGTHLGIVHESNSSQCSAMTVQADAGLVYWVSRQQLWSVQYTVPQAQARMVLQNENLITDFIQLDHHHLYWLSMQRKVLRILLQGENKSGTSSKDKAQLISQLGSQHLLLVAFRVSSAGTDRHLADQCMPLCRQGLQWREKEAKGAITGG